MVCVWLSPLHQLTNGVCAMLCVMPTGAVSRFPVGIITQPGGRVYPWRRVVSGYGSSPSFPGWGSLAQSNLWELVVYPGKLCCQSILRKLV